MKPHWRLLLGGLAVAFLLGASGLSIVVWPECDPKTSDGCFAGGVFWIMFAFIPIFVVSVMLAGIAVKGDLLGAPLGCVLGCGGLIALVALINVFAAVILLI